MATTRPKDNRNVLVHEQGTSDFSTIYKYEDNTSTSFTESFFDDDDDDDSIDIKKETADEKYFKLRTYLQRGPISQAIKEVLYTSFIQVYPPDSYDPITKEYNGKVVKSSKAKNRTVKDEELARCTNDYLSDPATLISSFFGVPNECEQGKEKTPFIVKNLKSIKVLHLLTVIPTTIKNILKLGTELLPRSLANLCNLASMHAYFQMEKAYIEHKGLHIELGYAVLYGLLTACRFVFQIANAAGMAITSPIKGIRSAWQNGNNFGKWIGKITGFPTVGKVVGYIAGGALATLSAATTVLAYFVLGAVVAPIFGAAAAAVKLPGFINSTVSAVSSFVQPAISWLSASVFIPVLAKMPFALKAVLAINGLITSAPAAASAIGFVVGVAVVTLGPVVDRAIVGFKKWWNSNKKPPNKTLKEQLLDNPDEITESNKNSPVPSPTPSPTPNPSPTPTKKMTAKPESPLLPSVREESESEDNQEHSSKKNTGFNKPLTLGQAASKFSVIQNQPESYLIETSPPPSPKGSGYNSEQ